MIASKPDLSLVLPCYNEELILEPSIVEIFRILFKFRMATEVILIDDASGDGTGAIIDGILAANPNRDLHKIEHIKNVGRGGAVAAGIRAARGPFVGFIDIDLEVKAQYILSCVLALEQGYDVATALRIHPLQLSSLHRHVMSHGYRALLKWRLGLPLQDTETGYKFFRRDQILPMLDNVIDQGWFWDTEIMVRAHLGGLRIIEIPALHQRRSDKTSSVRVFRDSFRHFRNLRRLSRSVSKSADKVDR